ncbi:MAG: nickel-dependent lactate racemase [Promethearchaeota archaeon]
MKIGREIETLSLPEDKILGVLTGPEISALDREEIKAQISEAVRDSLPENIKAKNIVLIVADHTRLWTKGDLYVPVIVSTLLEEGAIAENIKIIIALGTHNDTPVERMHELVGDETLERIEVLNSANKNTDRLTYIGKTTHGTSLYLTSEACEADHIIIYGGVLHHLLAGFGGGRKYIHPGIAGYDSIQQNHSLAIKRDGSLHPKVYQAILEGNPVHEDMNEGAEMFLRGRTSLLINVVENGEGEIFYVAKGDWKKAFEKGCEQVNQAGRILISRKADFVIFSAGGYEKDGQLYQSTKALFNSYSAVQEGGQILMFAEAREGVGNAEFGEMLKTYRGNMSALGEKLVDKFTMPSYVAYRIVDILSRYNVTLMSKLSREETEAFGFNYTDDIEEYVRNLQGKGYVILSAENILPFMKD